jgi:prepilin-type N-terminal cleavage/methylation domain-containing protein
MMRRRTDSGYSLIELVVSMALLSLVIAMVLTFYSLSSALSDAVRSSVRVQDNLRLGLDRLQRDLRMIGFAVPTGEELDSSEVWTPAIFHADGSELGFRAEIDGGHAMLTCKPSSMDLDCGLTELHVDRTVRFEELNCEDPSDPGNDLGLVVSGPGGEWQALSCSGVDATAGTLSVSNVRDDKFDAGVSTVQSIEHVSYRYVPSLTAPYGKLQRYVRYDNQPDDSYPPSGASWTTVASHLTDFWLAFEDESGNPLTGSPLSEAERRAVKQIVIFLEGYDVVGAGGRTHVVQVESRVMLRN